MGRQNEEPYFQVLRPLFRRGFLMQLTGYHDLACQLSTELVNHGWGELTLRVTSLKDNTVKIEILCGKSHVCFVKKDMEFKDII